MSILGEIQSRATAFLLAHPLNFVHAEDALREELVGMQIYDAPVFAVGAADDPLFGALRTEAAVHADYWLPGQWVAGAQSVVSFFAPYTATIRAANAKDADFPADEWLHGRYEGEKLMVTLRTFLRDLLVAEGYAAVAPLHDARYAMLGAYAPNWSERHTGFVCGLGTFGLSKGLITEKGVVGRIGSVITTAQLPPSQRPYQDRYAYCNRCGLCAARCPVGAIDAGRAEDDAKRHPPCDAFLGKVREASSAVDARKPRYGCGKCQVSVPCEDRIPV